MARPKNIRRGLPITIQLDEELLTRLNLFLFSEVEGRIPYAAQKRFIEARIQEFFSSKALPLERFNFPAGYFVTGPAAMIDRLQARLEEKEEG